MEQEAPAAAKKTRALRPAGVRVAPKDAALWRRFSDDHQRSPPVTDLLDHSVVTLAVPLGAEEQLPRIRRPDLRVQLHDCSG